MKRYAIFGTATGVKENAKGGYVRWEDHQAAINEIKAGYNQLDRNWCAVHNAAMSAIRQAVKVESVPEIVEEIERLRKAAGE